MYRLLRQSRFAQHFKVLWFVLRVAVAATCADHKNRLSDAMHEAVLRLPVSC